MENYKVSELYEMTRNHLMNSEEIERSIEGLKHKRLKEHLTEMLHAFQVDLLTLSDFLFELTTCEDENDIDYLLQCAEDDNPDESNFLFMVN